MNDLVFSTNGKEAFRVPSQTLEIRDMNEERDWKHYVTLIGLVIEDTIPNPSEIETLDAVRLLVRENNALRKAVGLPTYAEIAALEEKEIYGKTC